MTCLLRPPATNMIEAAKAKAKLTGEWVDLTALVAQGFPGRSDDEVRHFAETGRWPTRNALRHYEETGSWPDDETVQ